MVQGAAELRLAAIVFTDCEAGKRQPDVLRPLVERYHGRWIQQVGDGSLSCFQSAVDAVNCALAIRSSLENDPVRIGLHVGDVVFEAGGVRGDGVNVAAGLRALAEPGQVCASDEAQHAIRNQPNVETESLGTREIEGADHPVELFAIRGTPEAPSRLRSVRRRLAVWAASAAAALVLVGLALWYARAPGQPTVLGFSGRPAIAVLPFDTVSGGPEQAALAQGLAEDLTTRLGSWRSFPVISRGSSSDPDLPKDVQQAGLQLGARYLVEGSVRGVGDRVRISAQVTDATSGRSVWADQYDREIGDLLALQDEISEAIVGAINPALLHSEIRRAVHRDPQNLDAWNAAMKAWWHFNQSTQDDMNEAKKLFERAIELDPEWGYAHAGLALTQVWRLIFGWSEDPERDVGVLVASARKAVELDEAGAEANHALGHAYSMTQDFDRAISAFAEGVELNPSDHLANNCYGQFLALLGRPHDAIEPLERAMALSPRDPLAFVPTAGMARAYFALGDYEQALGWAEKSLLRAPQVLATYWVGAASAAHAGDLERAQRLMREAEQIAPLTMETFKGSFYGIAPLDFQERMIAGMRMAGWQG